MNTTKLTASILFQELCHIFGEENVYHTQGTNYVVQKEQRYRVLRSFSLYENGTLHVTHFLFSMKRSESVTDDRYARSFWLSYHESKISDLYDSISHGTSAYELYDAETINVARLLRGFPEKMTKLDNSVRRFLRTKIAISEASNTDDYWVLDDKTKRSILSLFTTYKYVFEHTGLYQKRSTNSKPLITCRFVSKSKIKEVFRNHEDFRGMSRRQLNDSTIIRVAHTYMDEQDNERTRIETFSF